MMDEDNVKPITDPKEIPSGLSDEEQMRFWETHGLTEEFLNKTEEVPEDELPRPRAATKSISVRIDAHTLNRLKELAKIRGMGYQTLLKEFVIERLYEEEKREGLIPGEISTALVDRALADLRQSDPLDLIPLRPWQDRN